MYFNYDITLSIFAYKLYKRRGSNNIAGNMQFNTLDIK